MLERIQLSRAKGWRMPENTVKVDRSTNWGNPFRVASPDTKRQGVWAVPTAEEPGCIKPPISPIHAWCKEHDRQGGVPYA